MFPGVVEVGDAVVLGVRGGWQREAVSRVRWETISRGVRGGLAKLGRCRMAGTACSLRPEPLLLGVTLLEQGVGQGELRGPLPTSAVL